MESVPVFFATICRGKTPLAGQIGGPEPLPRLNQRPGNCRGTQTAETPPAPKPCRGKIAAAITEPGREREMEWTACQYSLLQFAAAKHHWRGKLAGPNLCRAKTPLAGQIGGPEPLPRLK